MRRVKLLIGAGVLAAGVLGVAAPALSHNLTAYNPPDPSYGRYYDHSRFHPCDWHADGHRVRIRFTIDAEPNNSYYYTPWDSYGYNAYGEWCEYERVINHIQEFWLCIETEGCGAGVRHDD